MSDQGRIALSPSGVLKSQRGRCGHPHLPELVASSMTGIRIPPPSERQKLIRRERDSVFLAIVLMASSDPAPPPSGRIHAASSSLRSAGATLRIPLSPRDLELIRREGDSNPRYPFGAQLLSREPDSAALASLQITTIRRSEWDSNPRRLAAQRFSRPPHSTALPSLHSSWCAILKGMYPFVKAGYFSQIPG